MGDLVERLDTAQRQHGVLGFPLAVVYKYFDDQGPYLAAILTYYTFVAIFPMMLIASSVLGFVLQGDEDLQQELLASALSQFPIVGTQLAQPEGLTGSTSAVVIGSLAALYGMVGLGQAAQNALNTVWAVPRNSRLNPFTSRARSVLLLVLGGVTVLAIATLSSFASNLGSFGLELGPTLRWAGTGVSMVLTAVVMATMMRFATTRRPGFRTSLPGALLIAVGWHGLQVAGGTYVRSVVSRASDVNGVFALVLGLLGLIFVAAVIAVLGLEEPRLDGDDEPRPERVAAPGAPVVGHVRVAVHRAADPVPAELGVDPVAVGPGDRGDGRRDVPDLPAGTGGPDARSERPGRGVDEGQVLVTRGPDDDAQRGVRDPPVDGAGEVEAQQVAVAEHVVVRQAVEHCVVDRGAQHLAEGARAEARVVVDVAGLRPAVLDHLVGQGVEVEQVHPHVRGLGEPGEDLGDEAHGGTHLLDLGGRAQLDHGSPSLVERCQRIARTDPTGRPPPSRSSRPVARTAAASTPGSSSTPSRCSAAAMTTGRARAPPSSILSATARPSGRPTA